MKHIPQNLVDRVTVPWGKERELEASGLLKRAYTTCKRADKGHCINTNLVRAFAQYLGRTIRSPATYKGAFHWSELIDGRWCKFVAPLSLKYARVIDGYDYEGKHFRAPVRCPMGPVKFVGFCSEHTYTAKKQTEPQVEQQTEPQVEQQIKPQTEQFDLLPDLIEPQIERGAPLNARVEDGALVPGGRRREPQVPYVLA